MKKLYQLFKEHPFISTDSRNIIPGSIFFSLKGPTFNGNAFAENALSKGAVYAVIDEAAYEKDSRFILVDNALIALQNLANYYRHQCEIPFLAITGSNGKTTTKELINRVLSQKFNTLATKGNLNNHIGVPLTLLYVKEETEFAVIEMGANHQNEIESYCNIAEPDFGLITNVGKAHLEGFGGFEGVKKGKGELYEWIAQNGEAVFLNDDNAHLVSMAEKCKLPKIVKYGTKENVYCKGKLIREQPFLSVQWTCGEKSGTINSSIVGSYNFENILSAVCIGNYFGIDADKICKAIESYQPDNSRSQLVKKGSNTIVLDAYNANPTSMEAAINNFKNMPGENKIIFLGEMAELGDESEAEHKRIVEQLKECRFEKIFLVGKNFRPYSDTISCMFFEDSEKAAEWVRSNPIKDSFILIKGSRSMLMERVFEAI